MSQNPFGKRRSGIVPGSHESFTPVDDTPQIQDVVVVGSAPNAGTEWWVNIDGLPSSLDPTTRVSLRDDRLDRLKSMPGMVDMVGDLRGLLPRPSLLAFTGAKLPSFLVVVAPPHPAVGAERRTKAVDASLFTLDAAGRMNATVRWADMTPERVITATNTHEVHDEVVEEKSSNITPGKVVLVLAGAAFAYAAWRYWDSPRSNPSCCESCARGGSCRKKRRR